MTHRKWLMLHSFTSGMNFICFVIGCLNAYGLVLLIASFGMGLSFYAAKREYDRGTRYLHAERITCL